MDHMTALLEAQVQGMRAQPQPYVAPMASAGAAVRWTVGERPEPMHGQHIGSEQQASEGMGHARPGASTGGVGAASSAGAREDRHAGVPTDSGWIGGMAPVRVDAKVELPVYDGSIDGEKLDNWIDQLESYFSLYGYDDMQRIAFARLKLASHALIWWNSHLRTRGSGGLTWTAFKVLLKEQFYPVGYDEERWRRWLL